EIRRPGAAASAQGDRRAGCRRSSPSGCPPAVFAAWDAHKIDCPSNPAARRRSRARAHRPAGGRRHPGSGQSRATRAGRRALSRLVRALNAASRVRDDLRLAWRLLFRNPGFALLAILTLSLGIGATTAVFSVLDGVLLRQAPLPHIDRLV